MMIGCFPSLRFPRNEVAKVATFSQNFKNNCPHSPAPSRRGAFCPALICLINSYFLEIKSANFADFISGIPLTISHLAAVGARVLGKMLQIRALRKEGCSISSSLL